MSAIVSYARALAVATGAAQPVATVRHLHVSGRPLVFVPLSLAGEANAPLAALVGTDADRPTLLTVPQPRNRDLRFAFAARLADLVLGYVDGFLRQVEEVKGRIRFTDAPQVLVPGPAGIQFVRLLGRSTRFRRTHGRYPVEPGVPLLGRWLTWFAERAEHPGSSVLVAMTDALNLHWATGQSALEDANLAAVLGWLDPPHGLTGPEAARLAEDPLVWPPPGPSTDPTFDAEVLAPAIRAYGEAEPDSPARRRARSTLEHAVRGQLMPTWGLMWQAVARLRALPAGGSVEGRWTEDRQRFTSFHEYLSGGGFPQGRRDGAVAAARRLNSLERELVTYEANRAIDDPLVMAGHRVSGEAFAGVVVAVDRNRRRPNEKGTLVTRPLVTIRTTDPAHLSPGTAVAAVSRPGQNGIVLELDRTAEAVQVVLELSGGMGRAKIPPAGTVPEPDERLCYTSVLVENVPSPALPEAAETPWTHGGPPQPYQPTEDDAGEVWE